MHTRSVLQFVTIIILCLLAILLLVSSPHLVLVPYALYALSLILALISVKHSTKHYHVATILPGLMLSLLALILQGVIIQNPVRIFFAPQPVNGLLIIGLFLLYVTVRILIVQQLPDHHTVWAFNKKYLLLASIPLVLLLFISVPHGIAAWHGAKALQARQTGELSMAYNENLAAIDSSADEPEYHIRFARVSMDIAFYKAQNDPSNSKDVQKFVTQAIDHTKTAIHLQASNPHYWAQLGTIYVAMSQPGETENAQWAVAAFQRAISVSRAPRQHTLQLATYYTQINQTHQAMNLIKSEPSYIHDPEFMYLLGYAQYRLGNTEDARKSFELAIELYQKRGQPKNAQTTQNYLDSLLP